MSTESIASPARPSPVPRACAGCGAAMADDQRYCLECGERGAPMSSVLLGGPAGAGATADTPQAPPRPPGYPAPDAPQRGTGLTVIAGVGVLLLALGVGVLIGRSGAPKASSAPQQVVVAQSPAASTPGTGSAGGGSSEAAFSDDWPAGTSGYTVQLQTLAQAGTSVSAVQSAKASASAKGAKSVGALKSEDFSSLASGSYVIYSGVYKGASAAQKALSALRKSFPGAKVISVSNGGAGGSRGAGKSPSGSSGGGSSAGGSLNHPAPPSVTKSLQHSKGKSYEEQSKNLPDVISTG